MHLRSRGESSAMRFIQVGVGGFGAQWLGALNGDQRASLVALVDTDESALAAARQQTELPRSACFEDFRTAFEQVEADAVLNVTPPSVHREVALAAFERELHVLTEKPLADSMEHAREIVEAAEASDLTLMVSQDYRFYRWVKTIRHLLHQDGYGPPDNIYLRFARGLRVQGWRLTMEHPLLVDMSIHHFDLMRAITEREPLSTFAVTWNPGWSWFEHHPCCMAIFQFEDNIKVCYDASWVSQGRTTSWSGYWRVECAETTIELLSDSVHVVHTDYPDEDVEIELRDMPCEGMAYSLVEFQNAVKEDREPETSGRRNLNSLAMVYAVLESSETGKPVALEQD